MSARTGMVLAMLLGLSAAGCAPTLEGAGDRGGAIRQNQLQLDQLQLGANQTANVLAIAGKYCGQFARSAHIAREEARPLWTDTFTFDCIE